MRQEEAVIDEPIACETIEVERVPLDRWVEGPVPVRQEGDTMIVTLPAPLRARLCSELR